MDHPDFRVGGKIFATLSPGEKFGVIMLSAEQQAEFIAKSPDTFRPAQGGWGLKGSTEVDLSQADAAILREAMTLAWTKRAPKRLWQEEMEAEEG